MPGYGTTLPGKVTAHVKPSLSLLGTYDHREGLARIGLHPGTQFPGGISGPIRGPMWGGKYRRLKVELQAAPVKDATVGGAAAVSADDTATGADCPDRVP